MSYRALLAACLLFGCAPLPPVQASYRTLGQGDVQRTAKAIAALRGWQLERTPPVSLDDRDAFTAARVRTGARSVGHPASSTLATLFGVGPSPADAAAGKAKKAGKKENDVAGFYELDSGHVHVLAPKPRSDAEGLGQHGVLAHELIHALQDQKFKLRSGAGMSADARLAYRALIEGDASAAQLAYGAALQGLGVPRALRRARYAIAEPQRVGPAASPTADVGWASSPKAAATLRGFPYQDGLAFVVDLYRAGGFALVDEAYGRLPSATEHILHPEKYLADEQPRAFSALQPTNGITVVEWTAIGELLTRVVLEPCVGRKRAFAAAAGWNGDRAFVLSRDRSPMLGWVSAWDSESDAEAMYEALVELGGCLSDATVDGHTVSAKSAARREGAVVALVRGGDPGDHDPLIESLLALPGEAPPPTPLTKRVIPPLREP
ncbi:MAG: hypothetical protein JNK04_24380, partial [Myxococcales bacterium]|nr:hypothetical protein [Myxococcales bacterium]